jgi:hypothetical protein
LQLLSPGSTVNGAINASAPCQGRIGSINNDIDLKTSDIALNHG